MTDMETEIEGQVEKQRERGKGQSERGTEKGQSERDRESPSQSVNHKGTTIFFGGLFSFGGSQRTGTGTMREKTFADSTPCAHGSYAFAFTSIVLKFSVIRTKLFEIQSVSLILVFFGEALKYCSLLMYSL